MSSRSKWGTGIALHVYSTRVGRCGKVEMLAKTTSPVNSFSSLIARRAWVD